MRQQSTPPLLRLPPKIRKRIYFFDLPREIRLEILRYTITGPSNDSIPDARTIRVLNGKFDNRYPLTDFHPLELFLISRQMYLDASEIFYSEFQFHFQGHFSKTLSVLDKMPVQLLKRLRRITFDLDAQKILLWEQPPVHARSQWRELISFLGKYCNPSNMLISITARDCGASAMRLSEEDRKDIRRHDYNAYVDIVRTVKELLPDLRDFHLSFSIFWKLETVLEKFVMGPDYDSSHGNRYPKPRNTKWENSIAPKYLTEIPAWHTDVQEL
ncbi:unnamed protein product [Clonostachys byssicola]|uniref:Uncharacterized protein n=1 Tax=Clonostachys byssicola TaxID=160290 RepID=A0A9N9U0D1_9HYPO|nr:unnamed protein product [Clonostachys byssicola]